MVMLPYVAMTSAKPTFSQPSRRQRGRELGIFSTDRELLICHSLWQKYPGDTTSGFWRKSRTRQSGSGMSSIPSFTVGHGLFSFTRSKPAFITVWARPSPTLTSRSLRPQSDLAKQTLKDPYIFDFLSLAEEARERELERGLVEHIREFLIELGVGFSFVGRQFHLEVEGEDFYLDLLFYGCGVLSSST